MNKLDKTFAARKTNILNMYCTAGYPNLDSTETIMLALQENGADIIELGIPYSDPLADGPVIQESGGVALQNGMTIKTLIGQLQQLRSSVSVPVILMGIVTPFRSSRSLPPCPFDVPTIDTRRV